MTEKSTKPQLRFAGFDDTWEQRKLGDVADLVGGGTPSTYECVMGANDLVKAFADLIKEKGLDPTKFTVYTPNFEKNVCEKSERYGTGA